MEKYSSGRRGQFRKLLGANRLPEFESLFLRQSKPKSNTKVFGLLFIFLVKTANAYMQ